MARHRIMVLGDPKVGKTALKHCCLPIGEAEMIDSNGFELVELQYNQCTLEVWDLQEHFYYDEVPRSVLEDVHGVILVFDIGRLATFHNLPNWLDRIRALREEPLPVVIVGNKVDLRHWSSDVIKSPEAIALVERLNEVYGRELPYFEVSSFRTEVTQRITARLMEQVCSEFDHLDQNS